MKRLREYIAFRGVTEKQLAAAIGDSQSHVSQVLTGRLNPRFDWVQRVVKALEMSPQEIAAVLFAAEM